MSIKELTFEVLWFLACTRKHLIHVCASYTHNVPIEKSLSPIFPGCPGEENSGCVSAKNLAQQLIVH